MVYHVMCIKDNNEDFEWSLYCCMEVDPYIVDIITTMSY